MLSLLESMHNAGFVHRDIKPSNTVIGKDENDRKTIYLIDFGIAAEEKSERNKTI